MSHKSDYSPLYAERRCLTCGYWRGQHFGASANDNEMQCPVEMPWSFVPGPMRCELEL